MVRWLSEGVSFVGLSAAFLVPSAGASAWVSSVGGLAGWNTGDGSLAGVLVGSGVLGTSSAGGLSVPLSAASFLGAWVAFGLIGVTSEAAVSAAGVAPMTVASLRMLHVVTGVGVRGPFPFLGDFL